MGNGGISWLSALNCISFKYSHMHPSKGEAEGDFTTEEEQIEKMQ